jgi:hypothetical protein
MDREEREWRLPCSGLRDPECLCYRVITDIVITDIVIMSSLHCEALKVFSERPSG